MWFFDVRGLSLADNDGKGPPGSTLKSSSSCRRERRLDRYYPGNRGKEMLVRIHCPQWDCRTRLQFRRRTPVGCRISCSHFRSKLFSGPERLGTDGTGFRWRAVSIQAVRVVPVGVHTGNCQSPRGSMPESSPTPRAYRICGAQVTVERVHAVNLYLSICAVKLSLCRPSRAQGSRYPVCSAVTVAISLRASAPGPPSSRSCPPCCGRRGRRHTHRPPPKVYMLFHAVDGMLETHGMNWASGCSSAHIRQTAHARHRIGLQLRLRQIRRRILHNRWEHKRLYGSILHFPIPALLHWQAPPAGIPYPAAAFAVHIGYHTIAQFGS